MKPIHKFTKDLLKASIRDDVWSLVWNKNDYICLAKINSNAWRLVNNSTNINIQI